MCVGDMCRCTAWVRVLVVWAEGGVHGWYVEVGHVCSFVCVRGVGLCVPFEAFGVSPSP
jgi:hypothetical protein